MALTKVVLDSNCTLAFIAGNTLLKKISPSPLLFPIIKNNLLKYPKTQESRVTKQELRERKQVWNGCIGKLEKDM